jgi:hypothetical protein
MLADAHEPLILADGTKIDPSNGKVIREKKEGFIEIPSASQAVAIVAKAKRSVSELPLPPQKMNAVSLVLFYSMWGLADNDIAITVGITRDQVNNIKKLPEYLAASQDIQQSILQHETSEVRDIFQKHARGAAQKIVEIAANADEDSVLGFKAAQDVLDRAGHRPADVVLHKHGLDDSLKIVYIQQQPSETLPDASIVDAEFEEVKNADR